MPCIIMCGLPSSGKTRNVLSIVDFINNHWLSQYTDISPQIPNIHIIDDQAFFKSCNLNSNSASQTLSKNVVYMDVALEKQLRGFLRSELQRLISKKDLVIIDSLNYIKGFRYELYCVIKAAETPHCVVHCDIPLTTAKTWNTAENTTTFESYKDDVLIRLNDRFEPPNEKQRWDAPLFIINDQSNMQNLAPSIIDALFKRKAPAPNLSTVSQKCGTGGNYLQELERITQIVVQHILSMQTRCVPGDNITFPDCHETLMYRGGFTLAQLNRVRRQFVTFMLSRPPGGDDCDVTSVSTMFIKYLSSSL